MVERLRQWLARAIAFAFVLLAPASAPAQTVEHGPDAVSARLGNGPIYNFPYYNLPLSGTGLDYLAASRIGFENNLNYLRGNPILRARLSPAERRILDAVSVDVVNVDHVVFAASLRETGSVIKVSRGSAFFVDHFIFSMSLLEQLNDDMMIALALESEQGVNFGRRRWFQPQTYFAMRGVPYSPPAPTTWGFAHLNANLLVQTALMHELCHLFLGHGPIETPTLAQLRQREIDADRCAVGHLTALDANPEIGLTFALAVAVIEDPANSAHPASSERWEAARAAGDEYIASALASGRIVQQQAMSYRTNVRRIQNAIEFAARRSATAAEEPETQADPDSRVDGLETEAERPQAGQSDVPDSSSEG